jgi:hypothetical protein
MAPFRRPRRFRLPKILLFLFFSLNILEVLYVRHSISSIEAKKSLNFRLNKRGSNAGKKIFIASPLWNADSMLRGKTGNWSRALVTLTKDLGPENVFVSILGGGSRDDTEDGLRELDRDLEELGVRRKIVMDDETHEFLMAQPPADEGWVKLKNGTMQLRRIPFLAKIRNRTLQPLQDLWDAGERYDYVLFLGDVVFDSEDIITLLDTNDGDYAAACSLDFADPPLYYDSFVLRDDKSDPHLHQTWPYFRSRASRHALKQNKPVPVTTCWNGIVSMPAEPFVTPENPLRFRALHDALAPSHFEASECCLIHSDSSLFAKKPVFLNPAVRVGYTKTAHDAVNGNKPWISAYDIFTGLWENRIRRWISILFWSDRGRQMHLMRRIEAAEEQTGVKESAPWCVIEAMHVVSADGWELIPKYYS